MYNITKILKILPLLLLYKLNDVSELSSKPLSLVRKIIAYYQNTVGILKKIIFKKKKCNVFAAPLFM